MKYPYKWRKVITLVVLFMLFFQVKMNAQNEVKYFIKNSITDGTKLIEAYFNPWAKSTSAGFNNGWYNTAKPHKTGRFDLTFSVNLAFIPKVDRDFDISELDLSVLRLKNPGNKTGQTLFGKNEEGPTIEAVLRNPITSKDEAVYEFNSPPGIGLSIWPVPIAQFAIGIYKKTEVMVRFIPAISMGATDGTMKYWGLGFKHDILQWLSKAGDKAPIDLSVMLGYTSLTTEVGLEVEPEGNVVDNTGKAWDNQKLNLGIRGGTFNILVSKKLPVITFYGGVGYNWAKSTLTLTGDYPIVNSFDTNPGPTLGKPLVSSTKDPIDTEIKGGGSVRANGGFRLKFGVFTWHVDYTLAKYSVATTGFGICVDFKD